MEKKILLVDDEKALRLALKEALADSGYHVTVAGSGEEALKHACERDFDLVITDLKMQGIGGLELIEKVKGMNAGIRAIVMSAYGAMETVIDAMRLGVSDFLTKPLKIEAMRASVHRALSTNLTPRSAASPNKDETERFDIGRLAPFSNDADESDPYCVLYSSGQTLAARGVFDLFTRCDHIDDDSNAESDRGASAVIFGLLPQQVDHRAAELIGSAIKTTFRCEIKHDSGPQDVTRTINRTLCQNVRPVLPISLVCASWNNDTLRYVSVGEDIVTCIRHATGALEVLEGETYSLGTFPNVTLEERTIQRRDGEMIVSAAGVRLEQVKRSFAAASPPLNDGSATERKCAEIAEKIMSGIEHTQGSAVMAANLAPLVDTNLSLLGATPPWVSQRIPEGVMPIRSPFPSGRPVSSAPKMTTPCKEIIIPATTTNLGGIAEDMECTLGSLYVGPAEKRQIVAAVMEAVINSISHGYGRDSDFHPNKAKRIEGEILVRFTVQGKELIAEVFDQGRGFDFQSYAPPDVNKHEDLFKERGRGIFLMRNLMTRVAIESKVGSGTKIHMAKAVA